MMKNNQSVRITAIRATDNGAKLLLLLEGAGEGGRCRETLPLFAARLDRMPRAGEIDAETEAYYRRESAVCLAMDAGLRALSVGGCARRALVLKLRNKGFDAGVAADAATALAERGYLDEVGGACREVERGMAKLWGDRRILADIRAKGYSREALDAAVWRLQCEDGAARCAALIRRRHLIPANKREMAKVMGALTRYGYTHGEIKKALTEVGALAVILDG